jgi:putative membrane protein
MNPFWKRWLVTTIGVIAAARIVPGIAYESLGWLIFASLLLGICNAVVRPVLTLLALPLVIMTLGFFILIINALLLYFVGGILEPHFRIAGFGSAFWGSIVIGFVSFFVNRMIKDEKPPGPPNPPAARSKKPDLGKGPVIDV